MNDLAIGLQPEEEAHVKQFQGLGVRKEPAPANAHESVSSQGEYPDNA